MVKIYLEDGKIQSNEKGKYVNIKLSSIIKVDLISSLILTAIFAVGMAAIMMFLVLVANIFT
jgi:hypothetical protein